MNCLVCRRAGPLDIVLDLGEMPLANQLLAAGELDSTERRFPLRLARCRACGHIQLAEHAPASEMYGHYLYVPGASATLRAHFEELAAAVVETERLSAGDLVVDIGSNDGTLLGAFSRRGLKTVGVDPAENLAPLAERRGAEVLVDYFGAAVGRRVRGRWGPAQVITATNSFPHIADLDGYFAGLDLALDEDGVFVVEAHYLGDFLEQTAVDTVYHEHVSYWSLAALVEAARRRGFDVVSAGRLDIHHGQLRAVLARAGRRPVGDSVRLLLEQEERAGLRDAGTWTRWAARATAIAREFRAGLKDLAGQGSLLAGYGAPAKATTLLNYAGIGPRELPVIADRSPLKQGRTIPGCRIPVVSVEQMLDSRPRAVVVLAWNIAAEIAGELEGFRARGGRLFVPVPRFAEYAPREALAHV